MNFSDLLDDLEMIVDSTNIHTCTATMSCLHH